MNDTNALREKIQRFILPDHRIIRQDGMGKVKCASGSEWLWWSDYYSHVTDLLLDAVRDPEATIQRVREGPGSDGARSPLHRRAHIASVAGRSRLHPHHPRR